MCVSSTFIFLATNKVVKGKSKRGYITRSIPDRKRLQAKVDAIAKDIKAISRCPSKEQAVNAINLINSKIRGLVNYYQNCTWVHIAMENTLGA